MSLEAVRDGYLATRAAQGDAAAFEELARRYRPLLTAAAREVPEGHDRDDARQEALIGLFEACRATDGRRPFAGIARLNVRWQIARARRDAATIKHRLLTDSARDDGRPCGWLSAPQSNDPARIVELREQLRDHLRDRPAVLGLVLCEHDATRRHSAAKIADALRLIADGSTITVAAAAVGASHSTVRTWVDEAPVDSPARQALTQRRAQAPDGNLSRRFSDDQKRHAVELVTEGGRSLRTAAAAVGATSPTVLRWVRQAA